MKKTVEAIALGTIFPEEQVDNILKVCEGTPDAKVALNILLGIFEQPEVAQSVKDDDKYANKQLIRYCPFENRVYFRYNPINKKYGWYKKEETEYTEENAVSLKSWYEDACKEAGYEDIKAFEADFKKMSYDFSISDRVSETYTSLSDWNKYEIKVPISHHRV